jgi:hypothetical protein
MTTREVYANLGWVWEGEGRRDCRNCRNRVIAKIEGRDPNDLARKAVILRKALESEL